MVRTCLTWFVLVSAVFSTGSLSAAHKWGLKEGRPDIQSAGQMTFGPDGILFVGDTRGAAVFAIDTLDVKPSADFPAVNVENLGEKLSKAIGAETGIRDLAVNPISGNVYLSLAKGEGATPAIARIDGQGNISELKLDNVAFLKATLPNPPEDKVVGEGPRARNRRGEAITDLAFVEGRLLVSGMTSEKAPSAFLQIPFPFGETAGGTNVEIYHAAHGKSEDFAAIRTFIPMTIDGKPTILAGFTCTPLVRFELSSMQPGTKSRGTTVAELGNRNSPLDIVGYEQAGERYLLVANNNRGVMKVSTKEIGRENGLTQPVSGGGTAGQTFEKIASLEGTVQMDRLDAGRVVVIQLKDGKADLRTVTLP